jgi:hypothetical protein
LEKEREGRKERERLQQRGRGPQRDQEGIIGWEYVVAGRERAMETGRRIARPPGADDNYSGCARIARELS